MPNTALIYFVPCCAPVDTIITFRGAPIAGMTNNSYWVYTDATVILGQGTAPWDSLIPGQCYNVFFGSRPFISTAPILTLTVSSFSNSVAYFQTNKNCTAPYCVDICNLLPPQEFTNRYYKFTPCCDPDNPIYFKPVTLGTQIQTGVAIYSATITPNPYPSTDIFGNPDNPLIANFCYSITLEMTGPGMHVTNATEWNNLQEAPNNASSNFLYVSQGTSCTAPQVISSCPSCNPFCFTLWSCDDFQPLFTTYTDLTAYIGTNILVSSLDPNNNIVDVCVFVQNSTGNNCTNAIEVVVESESCECPCKCYTIIGEIKSVEWIDCEGVYHLVATPQSPFQICAGAYPLTYSSSPNIPLEIIDNGLCIESTIFNDKTCEEETVFNCEPACYLLEDCLDNTNVIYSNSPSLLGPANLGQVVTIAGYTECWKILIPEECICPINVSVLTVSKCCEACLPNINYKLTLCEDSTIFTYTSDDLSFYIGKVIRREDCPEKCWIVSEIDGNIPTDTPIVILEDYLDCEKCYRKYYLLEDCLGLELDIITYTDLSDYVDKVITLDWCPETCWTVTETIEDDGAGVISDVLNSYAECIDCLTNAPCICSTIKNYNDITISYPYLDCEGILQDIVLEPGQKSNRLCLIRWYVPKLCNELIITWTNGYYFINQNSFNHPGPILVNNKPTWYDYGYTTYVYYDGTKWILSKNNNPTIFPSVYTPIGFINCNGDYDCPTGTWENISSLPNLDIYTTTEFKYTIEYFGNCINGVCPPIKNKQKSVTPGYNTPGCEAWKYEEISCRAAEAMYKQVLQLRYGISNCCPEEDEQYIVQKELIDLAALNDPAYPCSTNSCGCNNNCNCSTAEPVCPVIPLTYNCFCTHTGCECIERGDGSGEYSTLALCQTSCVPIPVTYNCVNNNCTNPGDGSGEYLTLEACEEECQPITTYNCTNGSCVPVSGPLGEFPTLQDCEDDCQHVTSYNCVYIGVSIYSCVPVSGPSGTYATLAACQLDCGIVFTYNCIDLGAGQVCVPEPGSGGTYPTLAACTTACTPVVTTYNCIDGDCVSVSGSGGTYPTLAACTTACSSFITTWETTTPNETIQLPLCPTANGSIYSGTIDWGDGNITPTSYAGRYHTYVTPGIYTVIITGTCIGWNFTGSTSIFYPLNDRKKIKSVVHWGQLQFIPTGSPDEYPFGGGYFWACINLDMSLVDDVPNLIGVTSLVSMFQACNALTTVNLINSWDTSAITNMALIFALCNNFNQPINFNTLAVTNMYAMFSGCSVFNSPVSLNTSAVTNMSQMFRFCALFNQPLSFNTSQVTNMEAMFLDCRVFNSALTFTSTALVQNMSYMFANCWVFNQPIGSWNTGAVTTMREMFGVAQVFNQPIGSWNTSSVTNMYMMLANAYVFNQNIGTWDVGNVTSFGNFLQITALSTTNLDAIYCGWLPVQPNITISFSNAQFTNATGLACKNVLTGAPNNWIISDGGGV